MASLAYLVLPVSGAVAYSLGTSARVRAHGLQAIFLGLVWPISLYGASSVSPVLTQVIFAVGAMLWVVLFAGTAAGRDPKIPLVGDALWRLADGVDD